MNPLFICTCPEDLSVSRLLIGTNCFLGFLHTCQAEDQFLRDRQQRHEIAAMLATFFRAGLDTPYASRPESPHLQNAVKNAEDQTGIKRIKMGTPHLYLSGSLAARDMITRILYGFAKIGCAGCRPRPSHHRRPPRPAQPADSRHGYVRRHDTRTQHDPRPLVPHARNHRLHQRDICRRGNLHPDLQCHRSTVKLQGTRNKALLQTT